MTPKTPSGMAATIIYCVFGLPLTLMCIANLGKFFAKVFRIIYHTCCCGICCCCCLSYRKKKEMNKNKQNGGSTDLEAVGNGKSLIITNDPDAKIKPKPHFSLNKTQVWLLNVKRKFFHSLRDDVTVPVYLSLVVMAAYIILGALLFSLWDNWKYLEGAYFCFVTLTTIGFGDYVPGVVNNQGFSDRKGTERLILCSIYVILGLALVGMCIDLMQADVLQKVNWIGRKIGITKAAVHKRGDIELNVPLKRMNSEQKFMSSKDESSSETPLLAKLPDNQGTKPKSIRRNQDVHADGDSRRSTKDVERKEKSALLYDSVTFKAELPTNGTKSNGKRKRNKNTVQVKNFQQANEREPEQEDELLHEPPPEYAEVGPQLKSYPTTPASHYDNFPNEALTMTPLHERLENADTSLADQSLSVSGTRQAAIGAKRTPLATNTLTDANKLTTSHVGDINPTRQSKSNSSQPITMHLENGDGSELMLRVTKTSES